MKPTTKAKLKAYGMLVGNLLYFVGIYVFAKQGLLLWYFLVTTLLLVLIYRKQLWMFMNVGGRMYADFCMDKSGSIFGKFNKDIKEADEERRRLKNADTKESTAWIDETDAYKDAQGEQEAVLR